ncbi:CD209 antigen-like protein E [Archocentrus centrarchus]|uniref:CD209 antigen-like protein E n=1 Tax=Archocentrus centrarchus TaxID=63155 RepID=UPI0011EA35E2|nr:CD209 antigen-like protein E [Archocentrus centrarchus]
MSSELQTASDFRVKYSREAHEDRGVRRQGEVELQQPEAGLPEADEHSQRKLPAVRRSWFRVFEVSLGVLYLLILAGITTRYISVTLEKQQLQIEYDQLSNNYIELQPRLSVKCPGEWLKFGRSCYFKSTERKTWPESRTDCQNKGADLVIINSREEQEFISELNMKEESWIGLKTTYKGKSGEHEWEWVDGSPLTEA